MAKWEQGDGTNRGSDSIIYSEEGKQDTAGVGKMEREHEEKGRIARDHIRKTDSGKRNNTLERKKEKGEMSKSRRGKGGS